MRRREVRATLGSGADLALRQGIQFVVLLLLARILTPADFGTVALLAIYVSLAGVVADLGLTTAIVQSRELSRADISTAFLASTGVGLGLTVAGALLAVPLAGAFGKPALGPLAALMSASIFFTALGCVPSALLVRELQFGRLVIVGVIGTVSSGLVAVALAISNQGVWALAAQAVVMSMTTALGAWLAAQMRLSFHWAGESARRLLGMGRFVLAANVCDAVYGRGQTLLIGGVFGPAPLGQYMRADSTQQLPADAASAVVGRVALPLFARSSDNRLALANGLRTSLRSAMAVNAVVMALLASLAGPLVTVLYGPRWDQAVPLLTLLAVAGLVWPMHVMNINALYAVGAARTVFRIDLVKKGIAVALIGIGALFGLRGVASAQIVIGLVAAWINARAAEEVTGVGPRQQARLVLPIICVALATGGLLWLAQHVWSGDSALELVVLGGVGGLGYVLLARLLGATAVGDTLNMMRAGRSTP
ncbi:lipopolysaccharide biosynthesis protein [Pedococcus dokdonensis]|uniref:lipopolysaccharide biosynthesis protein n=1 Tax=Pedococcus dokdonensis TaxID=443156 RepID=UPI001E3E7960|nr:lipopolysaccharide biosynthesis protein [Pedococcus dokdonensis]